jgi:hypothetical protein
LCPQGKSGTVTISNNVTSIIHSAFSNCSSLVTVNFNADSCVNVGNDAWKNTNIKFLNIGSNVTNIPNNAFSGLRGFSYLEIPQSITSIGDNAFSGCTSVDTVKVFWQTPLARPSNVFSNSGNMVDKTLIIPHGTMMLYMNSVWREFLLVEAAPEVEVDVTTTENSVTIEWQAVEGTDEYVLIIYKDGTEVAHIHFDANGNIVQEMVMASKGVGKALSSFNYNVIGLSSGTTYNYTLTAYGAQDEVIAEKIGTFTTLGEPAATEYLAAGAAVRAYPNPTSSEITVSPTSVGAVVEVYNSVGLRVGVYPASAEQTIISLQNFPTGIYLVKLSGKIVKVVKR